jgi:hypothetical protein
MLNFKKIKKKIGGKMSKLDERKCVECGAELGVIFQQIRSFYSENGEIVEDHNLELMGPPQFDIHCTTDSEDEWRPSNISEEEEEKLNRWEKEVLNQVRNKFFNI